MKRTVDGAVLILFILHYFFLPTRLGKERFFIANNALNTTKAPLTSQAREEDLTSIYLSGHLSYIDREFALRNHLFWSDAMTSSSSSYVLYQPNSVENELYNYDGQLLSRIDNQGVPWLYQSDLYFVHSPSGRVDRYDTNGKLLWQYDVGAFISAFDANNKLVVIGDLVGNVTVLNEQGQLVGRYNAPGSEVEAIYGVAVSPTAQYIGVIGGVNHQRFILFRRGVNGYTPVAHQHSDEIYETLAIYFDKEEKFVYYEGKNKLFIFQIADNVKERTIKEIDWATLELSMLATNAKDRTLLVASNKQERQRLQVFTLGGEYLIADIEFDSEVGFLIQAQNERLLMAMDKSIMEVKWQ